MHGLIYALPLFFGLIGIEYFYSKRHSISLFRLNDSICNLGCGTFDVVLGLFTTSFIYWSYDTISVHFALFPNLKKLNWMNIFLLFILVDFIYYIFHHLSHRVNFLWAAHQVHHSSEEFNFTVALRQGPLQHVFSIPFYWPLALLGFETKMFIVISSLNTFYQFWVHTKTVNKVGLFEKIFNTPSHHRVHHAKEPMYWDKNFAGVFILWDKCFGTFKEELAPPSYGINRKVESLNPLWAAFIPWQDIVKRLALAPGFKNKFLVLFGLPSWSYPGEIREYRSQDFPKFNPPISQERSQVAFLGLVFLVLLTTTLLLLTEIQKLTWKLPWAGFIVLGYAMLGTYLESPQRKRELKF